MSTLNPLPTPGALDRGASPKSHVRITILTILALHVVFIGGLLLQGCGNQGAGSGGAPSSNAVSGLPPLTETNLFAAYPSDPVVARPPSVLPERPAPEPERRETPPALPPSRSPSNELGAGVTSGVTPAPLVNPPATPPSTPSTPSFPASSLATTEHVVKKGDTIGALAKRYGISTEAILRANPTAKPRGLKLESRLTIPAPPPEVRKDSPPAARKDTARPLDVPPGGETYLVKPGDNLTQIAKKFGVGVQELRAVNQLRGDRIVPQQRLIIPPKASPARPVSTGGTNV